MSGKALLVAVLAVIAVMLASANIVLAASAPDSHDRALVSALDRKLTLFRAIDANAFGATITRTFRGCVPLDTAIEKDAGKGKKGFGAALSGTLASAFELALPVTIDLADRYRSELGALRTTLATMHPDSPLFGRWRAAELRSVDFLLAFANHRTPPNPCTAAAYMQGLSAKSAHALAGALTAFSREVGISLPRYKALAPELYSNSDPAAALSALAPKMEAFFLAAGLAASDAAVLSSSE